MADIYGRKIFLTLTFTFFTLFPASLTVYTLREPARKALIVDLAEGEHQGKIIGLYYFIRSIAVIPASLLGGVLWIISPRIPFIAASLIGAVGVLLFITSKTDE